jgi:hypothetical protein
MLVSASVLGMNFINFAQLFNKFTRLSLVFRAVWPLFEFGCKSICISLEVEPHAYKGHYVHDALPRKCEFTRAYTNPEGAY